MAFILIPLLVFVKRDKIYNNIYSTRHTQHFYHHAASVTDKDLLDNRGSFRRCTQEVNALILGRPLLVNVMKLFQYSIHIHLCLRSLASNAFKEDFKIFNRYLSVFSIQHGRITDINGNSQNTFRFPLEETFSLKKSPLTISV